MNASNHPDLKFSKQLQTGNKVIEIKTDNPHSDIEDSLQVQCENYLKELKIEYFHIPKILYAKRRFKKKGIPDLLIFKETEEKYPQVLLIELKRDKGKMSQGQKNFSRKVTVHLVRNYNDFVELINKFMNEI